MSRTPQHRSCSSFSVYHLHNVTSSKQTKYSAREEINRASAMSVIDICKVVRNRCKPLEREVSIMCVISKEGLKGNYWSWMMLTRKLGSPSGCRVLAVGYSQWITTGSARVGGAMKSFFMFLLNRIFSFVHTILQPMFYVHTMLQPALIRQSASADGFIYLGGSRQPGRWPWLCWGIQSRGCCWQEPVPWEKGQQWIVWMLSCAFPTFSW